MIVKSDQAKQKSFKGVSFDVLACSEKSMVTKMNYKKGDHVPLHSHPNEQSGYVVSGEFEIQIGEQKDIITAGDSYIVEDDVLHALVAKTDGCIIDVFVPPREDYI